MGDGVDGAERRNRLRRESAAQGSDGSHRGAAEPPPSCAGSTPALQAEIVGLRAQVKELTLENEQLKHGPSGHTVPGEESAALVLRRVRLRRV